MYGVKDGIVCKGHSVDYSIKKYLYNQLSKNPTPNKKKLLVETLYYGAADQILNRNKEPIVSLVTDDLTEEQKAVHTTDIPEYVKVTAKEANPVPGNDIVNWRSGGLELSGAVLMKYTIELSKNCNLDDYDFVFTVENGSSKTISHRDYPELFESTAPKNSNNQAYIVTFDGLASHEYSKKIRSYVIDKSGKQASMTLTYSAESYTFSNTYKGSKDVQDLVDQMLRYGRANVAFRQNPNA